MHWILDSLDSLTGTTESPTGRQRMHVLEGVKDGRAMPRYYGSFAKMA